MVEGDFAEHDVAAPTAASSMFHEAYAGQAGQRLGPTRSGGHVEDSAAALDILLQPADVAGRLGRHDDQLRGRFSDSTRRDRQACAPRSCTLCRACRGRRARGNTSRPWGSSPRSVPT